MNLKQLIDSVDFKFLPLREGYGVEQSSSPVRSVQTSGGAARSRLDFPLVSFIASCTYELSFYSSPLEVYPQRDYDSFIAFFERYRRNPQAFSVLLCIDPTTAPDKIQRYMANIVPGSFSMGSFHARGARATMQLEAIAPG